jgi:hypothetical protein
MFMPVLPTDSVVQEPATASGMFLAFIDQSDFFRGQISPDARPRVRQEE